MDAEPPPAIAAERLRRVRRQLTAGGLDSAETLAQLALRRDPSSVEAVLLLARAAELRQGPKAKADLLHRHLPAVRDDLPLRRHLADALWQGGDVAGAVSVAQDIIDGGRGDVQDHLLIGRGRIRQGDLEGAQRAADAARMLAPERPRPWLQLARIALLRDGAEARARILSHYLDEIGDSPVIRRDLAETLCDLGAAEAAREHLSRIAAQGLTTSRDHLLQARIALAKADLAAAESQARTAARLAPDQPDPVLMLARIAHLKDGVAGRVRVLQGCAEPARHSFRIRMNTAQTLITARRRDEARQVAEAIEPRNCSDRQLFLLASILHQCDAQARAATCLDLIDPDGGLGNALLLFQALEGSLSADNALVSCADRNLLPDLHSRALDILAAPPPLRGRLNDAIDLDREADRLARRYASAAAYFGLPSEGPSPLVSILAPIHRRQDEENLAKQIERQDYPALEAVIVCSGDDVDPKRLSHRLAGCSGLSRTRILSLRGGTSLSAALNMGVAASRGDLIARFDADDIYLDDYLSRSIRFMQAMSADLCGKPEIFVHFEKIGGTILYDFCPQDYQPWAGSRDVVGSGSSLIVTRAAAERLSFAEELAEGEDRDFYRRALFHGFRVLFAPPFGHLVIRKSGERHTWQQSEARLLLEAQPRAPMFAGTAVEAESVMRNLQTAIRARLGPE
ncbi:MAG: glycosyltransferase [Paracoccus sp. (in: a-proteobacteria)]|uniref:glycosyltransferase n=2 Tax=Paracoccus TaxID=265 RepID=UPI0025F6DB9B|nr:MULTISPECIES: glycosyltransferase [unclassified Paracoccus (in: a-proteobacteria)]